MIGQKIQEYMQTNRGKQLALWLIFFLFWGGSVAYIMYISVYFESVNLSGRQIGVMTSIPFFVTLFSSVSFGFLSDVSKRNRLLIWLTTAGMIVILLLFPQMRSFWALLPLVLLYSIFHAPINPILDKTTLSTLENPEKYGKIRAGGSIGWGLSVLLTGYLIDNMGLGLPIIFYINAVVFLVFMVMVFFLPVSPPLKDKNDGEKITLKTIGKMVKQRSVIMLFLVLIIWGIGEASIGNYLFLHIKHLEGSFTLMGTALAVSLIGEIVTFTFANRIQAKLGEFRMILVAFVVLIVWLTGLSLIKDPNVIPAFQIFGGAGFALIQSGSVAYVNRNAPPELGTTAQALRGGLYAGLGNGLGTLISGTLYEFYGSAALFRIMSIFQICGLIFGIVVYLQDQRKRKLKPEK